MKLRDVWWSISDIGWVIGHSRIVSAPLWSAWRAVAAG
jgi:acyl-coenzyme A synthetase/AMP-(fatty) acid ligase